MIGPDLASLPMPQIVALHAEMRQGKPQRGARTQMAAACVGRTRQGGWDNYDKLSRHLRPWRFIG